MYLGTYAIAKETRRNDGVVVVEFDPVTVEGDESKGEESFTFTPHPQLYNPDLLEQVKTEEPGDWNAVSHKRIQTVSKDILTLLLKWKINIGSSNGGQSELSKLMQAVIESIKHSRELADEKMWGIHEYELNIQHVHDVLVPPTSIKEGVLPRRSRPRDKE